MNQPQKPKVFIASSKEGLRIAHAVHTLLDYDAVVTTWSSGSFRLSNHTAEDLIRMSSDVDFAIFVFHPDDTAEIRGETKQVVRDNVIFELGLFIGAIGRTRCYMVRPRDVDLYIPTDLVGLTLADYDTSRIEEDADSALIPACTKIKAEMRRNGLRQVTVVTETGTTTIKKANPPEFELCEEDFEFLAVAAASDVSSPLGLSSWTISNSLRGWSDPELNFSAIKLLRMGFIEKRISEDRDGDPFFSMFITDNGVDALLSRPRPPMRQASAPSTRPKPKPAPNFADMDDDIPF